MADDDFQDGDNDNSTEAPEQKGRNPQREYQDRIEKENRKLREENETKDAKLARATQAEREVAFLKAGANTDNPTVQLILETYKGDLTPEAIKVELEKHDLIPTSEKEDVKAELNALGEVSRASTGATSATPLSAIEEIRRPGASREEIIAAARKAGSTISDEEPGAIFSLFQ